MTFKELRKQKNEIQNKLNMANKTVCLQIEEIERLNKDLEIETAEKNRHYKNFIDEVCKHNRLETHFEASLFVISSLVLVLVVLLIKG